MSVSAGDRWNRRYASGDYRPRSDPAPFLERWLPDLPPGAALDIACGTGRNALRLAQAGYRTTAVDVSGVAIEIARAHGERLGLSVTWVASKVEEFVIDEGAYDLITVIRFVDHDLWPRLIAGTRPGGCILIEHHVKTDAEVVGPPDEFRLDSGELESAFQACDILHLDETIEPADRGVGMYAMARVVARVVG